MKLWGRKIFVVLVSVLTLGLYVPPTYVHTDAAENKEMAPEHPEGSYATSNEEIVPEHETPDIPDSESDSEEDYIHVIAELAKEQTMTKMGPRIIQKVDTDMTNEILPKIEEVVEMILAEVGEEELPYYEITEELTPGYGEKIFNLYNYKSGEEIAKFHVRRDKRPGEGYWFNFHYHLKDDEFVKHHSIGEIYWEKNTPPKWMS
ncbi:YpjP family protein [Halobacillus sp. BBL2006]|uniref:YpjP family protein n=1 Tax=Halobacillus sp. BBL2006 TaxID=1543706 RepID=UPI0005429F7B|nr:YpjP family protein [Halobacillus sp. BBL2006]KHE68566.1 hypothetical protein LD39_14390 [Halobacillus sp. BBL2006]